MLIWIKRLNIYGLSNWIILLLFLLSFVSIFTQMLGVSIFIPIFEFIFHGNMPNEANADSNKFIYYLQTIISFFGGSVGIESLLITAFVFFLIGQILTYLIGIINVYFSGKMTRDMRSKFFNNYLQAESNYYDKVDMGTFVNITTTELSGAITGVMAPIKLMVAIVSAVGSFFVLFLLSYQMTLLAVSLTSIALIYPMILIKRTIEAGRVNTQYNNTLVSFLMDKLRSPRLVRLSGTANAEEKEYSSITEQQRVNTLKIQLLKELVGIIFEPVVVLVSLVILYIAITWLDVSANMIMVYMIIMVKLVPIVRSILNQKQSINRNRGPIESIDKLLENIETSRREKAKKAQNDFQNKSILEIDQIEFKHVYYQYSADKNYALSDISLELEKATVVAIVGPSGSGKSTLIDLLSTYRYPSKGELLFNGLSFSNYKEKDLIAQISYVPQQPQIFDGSMYDHILYGSKGKTKGDAIQATKLSGAFQFIERLELGFETLLRDNGGNLSGGQRFKLDLSRALMSDASVLILDEPTSALDYDSKKAFIETVMEIKNKTQKFIVVITHDFSVLPFFEKIVVLSNGTIGSYDSHENLVRSNEWYANGISLSKV